MSNDKSTPEHNTQYAELPYRHCVGIALFNSKGQVFLGDRIGHGEDAWQMPQGGMDDNEDVIECALRELAEETGVNPDDVEVLDRTRVPLKYDFPVNEIPNIMGGNYRGQEQIWVALRYDGSDDAIDLLSCGEDMCEFSRWQWHDFDDSLIDMIVPFKANVYKAVLLTFRNLVS